jgi:hypothetical protein
MREGNCPSCLIHAISFLSFSLAQAFMKRILEFVWPLVGVVAVVWSLVQLYTKLSHEVSLDDNVAAMLVEGSLFNNIGVIAGVIGHKIGDIPALSFTLAGISSLVAYAALAWYDRIALLHLGKAKGISWAYIAACSFVTYALSHNIGASVFSGAAVRYRAYSAKGLTATDITVLIALCSFTFLFGTMLLLGLVLTGEPAILSPLVAIFPIFASILPAVRFVGLAMIGLCVLYAIGSWRNFPPMVLGGVTLVYPRLPIVVRQCLAAPLELVGAAGIIYFALPADGNPGFFIILGAFLLSFSAGLLSQVPGGIGVMEAVFLAVLPNMPAPSVFAALLVWRLFYLIIPLIFALPVIIGFERNSLIKVIAAKARRSDPL